MVNIGLKNYKLNDYNKIVIAKFIKFTKYSSGYVEKINKLFIPVVK